MTELQYLGHRLSGIYNSNKTVTTKLINSYFNMHQVVIVVKCSWIEAPGTAVYMRTVHAIQPIQITITNENTREESAVQLQVYLVSYNIDTNYHNRSDHICGILV